MSIPATTARLDCIIIGHHELDVSLLAQEAQDTQWLSGAYLSLASLTLVDHGQRLSYQTFLKQYITATTGQAPQLPTLYHTPSLTVCYLAHYLRRRQFSVASINFFTDQQDQLAALLTHQPRAVAITTTLYTRDLPIVEIVDFVRRRSPQTTIIVGGPHVFKAMKVDRQRGLAVGAESENWVGESPLPTRPDVQNVADKTAVFPVVPDYFLSRLRQPLQHAARLPAPGAALSQLDPAVSVLQVDHSDSDNVLRHRRAVLELHLHAQRIPSRRIELQLVVVAEPVMLGAGCDRARLDHMFLPAVMQLERSEALIDSVFTLLSANFAIRARLIAPPPPRRP